MNSSKNLIGQFIKEHRIKAGLSQGDVADTLGYKSPQFVSNWERGLAQPPLETLSVLVKLLKIDESKLIDVILIHTKNQLAQHLDNRITKKKVGRG